MKFKMKFKNLHLNEKWKFKLDFLQNSKSTIILDDSFFIFINCKT